MLAVVKTPRTNVRIEGDISTLMLEVLKKEYGKKLHLEEDAEESVNYFETAFAKKMEKLSTPGDCIQTYRENKSWTQDELGKRVGVSRSYVSDWENGRRKVSKDKAKLLTKLFGISPEYFI
jgi:DNA-binding transcriptional regulator YiaG